MRTLSLLSVFGAALVLGACTYVERERPPPAVVQQPAPTVVQPPPNTPPPVVVRPSY